MSRLWFEWASGEVGLEVGLERSKAPNPKPLSRNPRDVVCMQEILHHSIPLNEKCGFAGDSGGVAFLPSTT